MSRQSTLLFLLFFLFAGLVKGQDPIYSQFFASPLQLNPAFTGNTLAPHIALNYRNQWSTFTEGAQAYETYSVSYSQFSQQLNSGFGLMLLTDDAGQGLIKTNKIGGFYAYRLQITRDIFAKIGVEGSLIQTRLAWNQLTFGDQLDPFYGATTPGGTTLPSAEIAPDNLNRTVFDVSTGFLIYGPSFYGGLSLKHLNTPNESFLDVNENLNTGLPLRFTVHGGAEITLVEGNKRKQGSFISPNLMYIRQSDFAQINVGAYAGFGMVYGGLWYRHANTNPDAAIVLVGVRKDFFRIGYSFDIPVNPSLSLGDSGGSHEISVIFNFEKPFSYNYNDCFNLFR